jgi:hypothetical protein
MQSRDNRQTFPPLSAGDIEPLLAAAGTATGATTISLIRGLVRLPLQPDAWRAALLLVAKKLEQADAEEERTKLVEALAAIPLQRARFMLRTLADTGPATMRQVAIEQLRLVHDVSAVASAVNALAQGPTERRAAARFLGTTVRQLPPDLLTSALRTYEATDAVVAFWLSFGLARNEEDAAIVKVWSALSPSDVDQIADEHEDENYLTRNHIWETIHLLPQHVLTKLANVPSPPALSGTVERQLQHLKNAADAPPPSYSGLILGRDEADAVGQRWLAHPPELGANDSPYFFENYRWLEQMSPALKSQVVTRLMRARLEIRDALLAADPSREYGLMDGGEYTAYHIGFLHPFEPDVAGLFQVFEDADGIDGAAQYQCAAIVALEPDIKILGAILPALQSGDPVRQGRAGLFIELAQRYRLSPGIPTWGGGGGPPNVDLPSETIDLDDEAVATDLPQGAQAEGVAVEQRLLQVRMWDVAQATAVNAALRLGSEYRLDVRIARPELGWIDAPGTFPVDMLPPSIDGHWLDVVLVVTGLEQQPHTSRILLPPDADSEACSFKFSIPRELARFDARVTVLYRNRILQSVRITAPVGSQQTNTPGLEIETPAIFRAGLREIAQSAGFELALLFNGSDGVPYLTAFSDEAPAYVSLSGIDQLRRALRATLEEITRESAAFQDATSERTRELYLTLARAGRGFLDGLSDLPRMKGVLQRLGASGRLQVTSQQPDDLVPLELIYDGPFPSEHAKLCPALTSKHSCNGDCAASESVVCAARFWGVRHVIERRLFDEHTPAVVGATHSFLAEPTAGRSAVPPLRSVLCGTAQRAAAFDQESFTKTMHEISAMLAAAQANLVEVDDWERWTQEVASSSPQLLLLIAHTAPLLGATVLEIGTAAHLAAGQITGLHVAVPPPTPPNPGPIVLLFGCRTAGEEVPFSNFVAAFRRARASVIIGTLSTVRGRHMAPVAKHILELLLHRSTCSRTSLGEVMRDLRRDLVANALPIGLTLVSFGDADWQLGAEG